MSKFKLFSLILGGVFLFSLPIAAWAAGNFYLAPDDNYYANLYHIGGEVDIAGIVAGDVMVVADKIVVSGEIKGDLLAVASDIDISGIINGNVRILAQTASVNADIKRAATLAGGQIFVNDKTTVGATVIVAAQQVEMRGEIAGNLDGWADRLFLTGSVTHTNLRVAQLQLSDTAKVKGNLNYISNQSAQVADGAQIGGGTYQKLRSVEWQSLSSAQWWWRRLWQWLSWFLVGLLLFWPSRHWSAKLWSRAEGNWWPTLLRGALFFFVIPIAIALLLLSIIGAPLALLLLGAYLALLYLSRLVAAWWLGKLVVRRWKVKWEWPWIYALGLVLYIILVNLPWLGGLFSSLSIWLVWGSIWQWFRKRKIN
ncbi:MAG: hypothetical protein ACKKL5_00490 [Candidatus Komeilibacteria bacterium]